MCLNVISDDVINKTEDESYRWQFHVPIHN